MNLLFIGNFSIDNIITPEKQILLRQLGGNSVFSALGALFWREDVGILSQIPKNYPVYLLDFLKQRGLDLRNLIEREDVVDSEEWFFYRKDGSRLDGLFASAETIRKITDGEFLNETEISLLQQEIIQKSQGGKGFSYGDLVRTYPLKTDMLDTIDFSTIKGCHIATNSYEVHSSFAKAIKEINRNIFITLDPAFYLRSISKGKLNSLFEYIDAFLPSEVELNALMPNLSPEDALIRLTDFPSRIVGVKLGGKGSLILDRKSNKIVHVPAYKANPRNLNGAGDAYCGGFLAGMVESNNAILAAKYGTVSASLIIERTNYQSIRFITREVALQRLEDLDYDI